MTFTAMVANVPSRDAGGSPWHDWSPWFAVLGALIADAGMQEAYFRLGAEWPRLVLLAGGLAVSVVLVAWLRPGARLWRWAPTAAGLALLLPLHPATAAWLSGPNAGGTLLEAVAIFLLLAVLGWRIAEGLLRRVRLSVTVGVVIFAASGPLLAMALSHSVPWLTANPAHAGSRTATVFILLDELNWNASASIADALRESGLEVRARPIASVGDATAKVVPEMIARVPFAAAAACLTSAICSHGHVLNFSRIEVPPDVDVVGFYHPYCAIRGLRSCYVARPASPATDPKRWRCAALRRLPSRHDAAEEKACAVLTESVARDHLQDLVAALDHAPVWTRGGTLFAHLPLPHPPGVANAGTLSAQYRGNVAVAAQLIRRVALRLKAGGFDGARVVIFSDHPLRPALWCALPGYAHNGCPLPPSDVDTQVPLIAAGFSDWTAFETMRTNADVFSLGAAR